RGPKRRDEVHQCFCQTKRTPCSASSEPCQLPLLQPAIPAESFARRAHRSGSRHTNRRLQMKTHQRLCRDLHLLSPCHSTYAGHPVLPPFPPPPPPPPAPPPDRPPPPPANSPAKDRSTRSPSAGFHRRILTSPCSLFRERIRHHIYGMIHRIDPCQFNR